MSDFIVVKNIKASLGDISISDPTPDENAEYTLMVDVSLYEQKIKKGTGEENPATTFVFEPIGRIVLVNKNKLGLTETPTEPITSQERETQAV